MILGVSFDSVAANKAFAEKYGYQFRLLCDTSRDVGLKYGAARDAKEASAKRISYLIGPDGVIRQVWGKVDVSKHSADVLAAITSSSKS